MTINSEQGKIKCFWNWLWSLNPVEKQVNDPAIKLLNSMRITAKCRFNASGSLKNISNYSFLTTTVLSLGLIFIPLLQITGKQLPYSSEALTAIQIFLAVSILVYSVVIATAKYELRSNSLDNCGVKIKELTRKLRNDIYESKDTGVSIDLESYHRRYNKITSSSENHKRCHFELCRLQTVDEFKITGIRRRGLYCKSYFLSVIPYIIPTMLMIIEVLFISDLLGISSIFVSYFDTESMTSRSTAYQHINITTNSQL
ncbi:MULTISPECIES: SLATT domain-containing protein [Providencia]|uniref:SLATT domain-containing protein n=1 Tax=Providencia TaxID=586 RepID=UPI0019820456|nr:MULTISPECIES: SLATT domain-containing protein [Providencia]MBN4866605.1 SLATT domain-containing protein [Providencia stuartii]MBN4876123.1 SLATT domain-containing protein [Providencia stuartii]MBN4880619.1 SLATT domain-containing protein [Providencia stuartii]MBN4885323.1 SLATT domain-containing protein [Providencia stuartii]